MTDRLLISYPKSGRTWVRYIFHLARMDVEFQHAGFDFGQEARPIFDMADGRRTIFLHRDPIDTAVSLFFHLNTYLFPPLTLRSAKAFVSGRLPPRSMIAFLDHPGFGVERACKYNRAWLDHIAAERPDAMVVRYEEMSADPVGTLAGVLTHFGGDGGTAADLIEQSAFDKMQAIERSGSAPQSLRLHRRDRRNPTSRKVRRGKVGGYRDYLPCEEQHRFEAICSRYDLCEITSSP